jgi:excinuclease ABC subunit A
LFPKNVDELKEISAIDTTAKPFKLNIKANRWRSLSDKRIADVLNILEEGLGFFENIPRAAARLQTLVDVGLGYVKLGQTAPILSGGEAQRVKLATKLSKRATGKTLYLIDEPTTGLSFSETAYPRGIGDYLSDSVRGILD